MNPIDELMDEHRVIEQVLSALEAADAETMPLSFYERAVDFIAHFADGCHHSKEEGELFPLLERKGIARHGGPIGVMCEEHEIGRALVRRMREAIEAEDRPVLREAASEYCALLRGHIAKEDDVLFPMGRRCLTEVEVMTLRRHFDRIDETATCHRKYAQLGKDLKTEAGA